MKPSISFTILGTVGLLRIHEYANIPNKDADIDPPPLSLSQAGNAKTREKFILNRFEL